MKTLATHEKSIWQEQIEKTKQDPDYNEQEKHNIIENLKLLEYLENEGKKKETRTKAKQRAKFLARTIFKKKAELQAMQKELSQIFYNEDLATRAFTYSERKDPKSDKIKEALKIQV